MTDKHKAHIDRVTAWQKKGPRGKATIAQLKAPAVAEVEAWARENGITVDILKGPTGKMEGIGFNTPAEELLFKQRFFR